MDAKVPAIVIAIALVGAGAYVYVSGMEDDDGEPPFIPPPPPPSEYEDVRIFTVLDPETLEPLDEEPWAVFNRSEGGNCCEHYLAATQYGWITNLGGEYPTFSKDRGLTWDQYRTPTGTVDYLGEGAIVQASNGDILATGWFPYSGDRFIAFFYDNESGEWSWRENHWGYAPFYDRPWIVEVKGPISWLGSDYPWASLVVSNFWQDLVISVDGLNYFQIEEPQQDLPQLYPEMAFDLDFEPGPEFDYMQPHKGIHAFPLPTGGLLMPGYFDNGDDAMLTTDLTWARRVPVEGQPLPSNCTWLDSSGALHSIVQDDLTLTVHQSLDGGRTWRSMDFTWANASWIEEWEFHAHGGRGVAALNMRAQVGDIDVDLLWQMFDYRESLEPDRLVLLGQGDLDATAGAGADIRFDFASIAILPDGGVAVSYADTTDPDPLFALELELDV